MEVVSQGKEQVWDSLKDNDKNRDRITRQLPTFKCFFVFVLNDFNCFGMCSWQEHFNPTGAIDTTQKVQDCLSARCFRCKYPASGVARL